jgi:ribosome-associated protein
MSEPIVIREQGQHVVVPAAAIAFAAVRASGPGGQNVNKVASKVELRVDLARVVGLDDGARARLMAACAGRLDADGRLLVISQKTRDQLQNLEDAREKIRALVAAALVRPIPRRKTRPTRGSVERRIGEKKIKSAIKRDRRVRDE